MNMFAWQCARYVWRRYQTSV